jgi:hypothetical protein
LNLFSAAKLGTFRTSANRFFLLDYGKILFLSGIPPNEDIKSHEYYVGNIKRKTPEENVASGVLLL